MIAAVAAVSIIFDKQGYGYVMGDGRNYALQMYANAAGKAAPKNCLLRIPPGGTDFEEDFFYTIPALTGGLESITEIETGVQGSGLGFAKMFDPSKLPDDVKPVDFTFWDYPAHKLWRIELADPPVAKAVDGLPYRRSASTAVPSAASSTLGRASTWARRATSTRLTRSRITAPYASR